MTRPINTAPSDTTRAMHAAEMRGQDMQNAPEQIWIANTKPQGEIWRKGFDEKPTGEFSHRYVKYTRTDLCITEAECQHRIDAAVAAEREACAIIAERQYAIFSSNEYATGQPMSSIGERFACDVIYDAIRARGQKTEAQSLRDLLAKVEDRKQCTIPTPHYHAKLRDDGTTARIMGYIEGYAVMRHTGSVPFCIHVNEVVQHLKSLIAQAEK